ncbi:MAG: hypothetical protein GY856_41005 [bacterium]|nr:hypothetical protein [bacterium]
MAACLAAAGAVAQELVVYDDQLQNGFANWSWATHSLLNPDPVHAGDYSVSMEPDGWEAVWFRRSAVLDGSAYESLVLWIHGGPSGGQALAVVAQYGDTTLGSAALSDYLAGGTLPGNQWVEVEVPLADIGVTPDPIPWGDEPDAGNGLCDETVNTTGYCVEGQIAGNDPADTSVAVDAGFVTGWMAHIASRVGTASEGGVRFYALDNEPMLWSSTHRDVHPAPGRPRRGARPAESPRATGRRSKDGSPQDRPRTESVAKRWPYSWRELR